MAFRHLPVAWIGHSRCGRGAGAAADMQKELIMVCESNRDCGDWQCRVVLTGASRELALMRFVQLQRSGELPAMCEIEPDRYRVCHPVPAPAPMRRQTAGLA